MFGVWSDRRNRAKLSERNRWLDAAINNMIQGLCMFDAQNRLLVWNERYRAMYNIDPSKIWRGCTIRDLLDARIAAGTFPLDPARYDAELRAALKAGKAFTLNIELGGRPHHRRRQSADLERRLGGDARRHHRAQAREEELGRTRIFLDTIVSNIPTPLIGKDVKDFQLSAGQQGGGKFFGINRRRNHRQNRA